MRTLGPVVAVFTDIWEAYDYAKSHEDCMVTGHVDGWCVRRWINIEVPA